MHPSLMLVPIVALTWTVQLAACDPPLLSGPQVNSADGRAPTLVRLDYEGRLVRLDTSPEEAALDEIELDQYTRERILSILSERTAILDRVVMQSLPLFQQFDVAEQEKDGAAKGRLLGEFTHRLAPLIRRGTLFDELYAVLPREQASTFARMVDEYQQALIRDARRQAEIENRAFNAVEAAMQVRGEAMLKAIERSFARSTQSGEREFDELLEKLDLSPEGEQIVRARATRFAEDTMLNPTKAQTVFFVVQVLSELEPNERVKVVRRVIEINREQKAAEREVELRKEREQKEPMQMDEP